MIVLFTVFLWWFVAFSLPERVPFAIRPPPLLLPLRVQARPPEEQAAGALVAAKQELMVHALLWQYGPNLPASIRDAWALAAAFDLATVNAPPQGIIHYSVVMLANNASDVVCERLY